MNAIRLYDCPTCAARAGEPCEGTSATDPTDSRPCPERRALPVPTEAQLRGLRSVECGSLAVVAYFRAHRSASAVLRRCERIGWICWSAGGDRALTPEGLRVVRACTEGGA